MYVMTSELAKVPDWNTCAVLNGTSGTTFVSYEDKKKKKKIKTQLEFNLIEIVFKKRNFH